MSDETEVLVILETDDGGREYYYNTKDGTLMQRPKKAKVERTSKTKGTPTIEERRKLAEHIQRERAIWDVLDDAHRKRAARIDAWLRVAEEMPNRTVPELKSMWTNLKDTANYLRRRKEASGKDTCWELMDCLGFILEGVSSRVKQRSNILTRIPANNPQFSPSGANQSIDYQQECDTAESDRDPLKPMPRIDAATPPSIQPNINRLPLKYAFVWQFLEHLYLKLSHKEIEELNVEFINLVYDKIKNKQTKERRR